jgi:hypothetical protein
VTSLVYVYAVLRKPVAANLVGINGQPVRWISANTANLVAAVSDVPAAEFDEEPLNEGVRNMAWLGPRAVAHQEVNYRLHEAAETMVPLAFGTVFRDDERVRQLLRERWENLGERLAAVQAAGEWVVALHLLREPAAELVAQASPAIRALRADVHSSGPGRAHLLRRRMAELERAEARRFSDESAEEALGSLSAVAADIFREPLAADTVERPLLRASVLVRRDREAQFLEVVERLQAQFAEPTYRLVLTGPWPPYRFGGISTRADPDG